MAFAALIQIRLFSSHISSVQSIAFPPVDKFALCLSIIFSLIFGILSSVYPLSFNVFFISSSIFTLVKGFSWSSPLNGSVFKIDISSSIVLFPSPYTVGGILKEAATTSLFTTQTL